MNSGESSYLSGTDTAAAYSIAVFDIDGTLYGVNTLYDFLERFHASRSLLWWALFRSARLIPGKVVWRVVTLLSPGELFRRLAFRSLRGVDEASFNTACQDYVRDVLPAKAVGEVIALLREHRERGYTVVLASGSIVPLVSEISRSLDADDWFAARPIVVERHFTGDVDGDVRGKKLATVEKAYSEVSELIVVTDNKDDLPLVRKASRAWIVTRRKNRNWWQQQKLAHVTLIERL